MILDDDDDAPELDDDELDDDELDDGTSVNCSPGTTLPVLDEMSDAVAMPDDARIAARFFVLSLARLYSLARRFNASKSCLAAASHSSLLTCCSVVDGSGGPRTDWNTRMFSGVAAVVSLSGITMSASSRWPIAVVGAGGLGFCVLDFFDLACVLLLLLEDWFRLLPVCFSCVEYRFGFCGGGFADVESFRFDFFFFFCIGGGESIGIGHTGNKSGSLFVFDFLCFSSGGNIHTIQKPTSRFMWTHKNDFYCIRVQDMLGVTVVVCYPIEPQTYLRITGFDCTLCSCIQYVAAVSYQYHHT